MLKEEESQETGIIKIPTMKWPKAAAKRIKQPCSKSISIWIQSKPFLTIYRIVRISIHEGDNIDKIVQKFNDIFHLKPKQIQLLTQRLKTQYEEMTSKNYESYEY